MGKDIHLKEKINEYDTIRGVAIFIMVLAHVIAFTSNETNQFLNLLRLIGDTFAFSLFFTVSGAVNYISLEKKGFQFDKRKIFRILKFLLIYYVLAFLPYIKDGSFTSNWWQVLTFLKVPNYTEFLIPFIIVGLVFYFFPSLLKYLTKNMGISISVVFICIITSFLMYPIDMGPLNAWKSLFVGSFELYRFPALTYFPLFLTAAYLARNKITENKNFIINSLMIVGLIPIVSLFFPNNFQRWPPGLGFISIGLFVYIFFCGIGKYLENKLLLYIGRKPLEILFFHLLILNILDIWVYKTYNNTLTVLLYFVGILSISILLTKLFDVLGEKIKTTKTKTT